MKVAEARFLISAVKPSQYPDSSLPEVAFAGRSNVGKSSLLNMLTGIRSLAKVSASPGKTRTINFFLINNSLRIVDLPGYGYARVSKTMSESWGEMMESYLSTRPNLKGVVLLVDSRIQPTAQDVQMMEYLRYYHLDGVVVATKADKLSKSQLAKNLSVIKNTLSLGENDILIPSSASARLGADRILGVIEGMVKK